MTDLRTYFDDEIAKSSLPSLAVDSNIFSIVEGELWVCLQALDATPRSDPFWTPSNNKATIHKLTEFAEKILMKNNKERAIRCKFSVSVLFGGNDVLSDNAWDVLRADPRFRVDWLTDVGWWFSPYTGVDTAEWVAHMLKRFRILTEGKETLAVLIQNSDEQKKEWLITVRELIEVPA